jgi:hypothetical protein
MAAGDHDRPRVARAIVCVPDDTPGPRDACPDPLHDHPMPSGYVAFFEEANRRGAAGWRSRRCLRCGLYGWAGPQGDAA